MKNLICTVSVVLFLILTLSAHPTLAATIHVPSEQSTIQAGIDVALDGDLIQVAPGTYVENIAFPGKAITMQSEAGADETIIDGNQAGSVVTVSSVVIDEAIIDGFAIRNGEAYDGGGIWCYNSNLTITNCTISGNRATDSIFSSGGGIYCDNSSATITNCTISGNITNDRGGGIYYYYDSSSTITNCTISGNSTASSSGDGGGINCYYSDPTIMNCTISGNRTLGAGGGMNCSASYPTITNCTITDNIASSYSGGGISCFSSDPTITNCTISGNIAEDHGGGIYCSSSDPMITNCTITGNSAYDGGGIFCYHLPSLPSPTITNCILWGNDALDGPEIYGGSPVVTYSDVQGGWPGEGNIDSDPIFVGGGDFHLTAGSPCIDAGIDVGVYTDIDGDERPQGAGFDMGAYEYPECWDGDMDGYGSPACGGVDCDDTDPGVNPGAQEICTGGIDEDCDGLIDSDDPDCVTIHVPADQPTIQSAIDMALDGNLVVVAPGTYVENIDFLGKAITMRSEAGADGTIIDGNQAGSVVTFSSGMTEEAVIDGFTIRNGDAYEGGGIYCSLTSPTIMNCTISGNIAESYGGGIYCYSSYPTITNCTISGNIAESYGGGIYCDHSYPTITNCIISDNSASLDFHGSPPT